jgi:hypothetical protein
MKNFISIASSGTVPCPREPALRIIRSGVLRCWLVAALAACTSAPTDGAPAGEAPTDAGVHGRKSASDPGSASYRPPPTASIEIVEVPDTGIRLGWGWNSVDHEPVPNICVQFVEGNEPAQTRYMSMSEVSDSYELMDSFGMSAAASVKTIGYSVSGKAKFAKDLDITGFSSNFVLNATVENGVRFAAPVPSNINTGTADAASIAERGGRQAEVRLTPEALKLAGKHDSSEFRHLCGDSFVSAVYSGAKLTGVITIETKSREEKKSFSAELAGAGWGARLSANMDRSKGSKNENRKMDVSIFQTGGRGDEIPVTSADLLEKLKRLSSIAAEAPKDFHMAVMPYETLSNWPAASLMVEENEYDQLASYWGSYNTLYDEIQHALDHPERFSVATMTAGCVKIGASRHLSAQQLERLERVQDEVLDALLRLQRFAQYCATSESGCEFPEGQFRSPYAYRTQLPLSLESSAELMRLIELERVGLAPRAKHEWRVLIDELVTAHISEPAKRRCNLAKDNPGCLSNAEIRGWRDKIGMDQGTFSSVGERDRVVAKLLARKLELKPLGCGDLETPAPAIFSVEPGFPALWYDPRAKTCIEHPDAEAPAGQCPPG